MPKLARQYDDWRYNQYHVSSDYTRQYRTEYRYNTTQTPRVAQISYKKPHIKKHEVKRRNPFKALISFGMLLTLLCFAMPYSFNGITKAIFCPTPYKNIKTDMYSLAFPINDYLSNSLALNQRVMSYSANEKQAQMVSMKENVNMPVLHRELLNLMELYPTVKPAIYVWDYDTQNYVDINASKIYATASIIKIPVLIDLFKSIESGQLTLDETMPLTEYYRTEGSGSLQFMARNSQYTIDELARRMIVESDNSATNMLMARLGSMTDVNRAMRDWGLQDTGVITWLPDLSGNNYTTARDMGTMLYNIDENDKFLTEASRAKIFDYMGHVHNNRLIQAGLGAGSVFLHKTGDIGKMLGDAGIVIAPNGKKYVVVILANRPHNSVAGKEFIVKASEIIYNYMVK